MKQHERPNLRSAISRAFEYFAAAALIAIAGAVIGHAIGAAASRAMAPVNAAIEGAK